MLPVQVPAVCSCCTTSRLSWQSSPLALKVDVPHCFESTKCAREFVMAGSIHVSLRGAVRKARSSSIDENSDLLSNSTTTRTEFEKESLAAKLAAAEAEAEALRKELSVRRSIDISKLKPETPEKRIDGTGYRETLFAGPGKPTDGTQKNTVNQWGLSEAELFFSKGAPTEGSGLGGSAMETGAGEIIKRRVFIGVGLTAVTLGLSSLKLPTVLNKPTKPLFLYLTTIIQLRDQLQDIESTASDAKSIQAHLQRAVVSREAVRDTLLCASALLDGAKTDRANALAFSILEYLNQADASKYFENLGQQSSTQELQSYKFSLQSVKVARENLEEFLSLAPSDALNAARLQLAR